MKPRKSSLSESLSISPPWATIYSVVRSNSSPSSTGGLENPPNTTRCQKLATCTTCALNNDVQRRGTSGAVILFSTFSVLTGAEWEILLRQSVPDIETDFARSAPRSKAVNNLAYQILPPVDPLCDPIEGTDRARLAQCSGKCLLTACNGDSS